MKRTILVLLLAINYILFSNENLSFGLNASVKAGVSIIETPKGRQNGLSFNQYPDVNLSLYIPITLEERIGAITEVGFTNYSYLINNYSTGTSYKNSFSFIGLTQSIYFNGFLFGFGVNFPVSYDIDGATQKLDNVNTTFDLQFGYMYDLYRDESASFAVFIKAFYQLNGNFSEFTKNDPFKTLIPEVAGYPINNGHNPRAVALSIGFSYYYLGGESQ